MGQLNRFGLKVLITYNSYEYGADFLAENTANLPSINLVRQKQSHSMHLNRF